MSLSPSLPQTTTKLIRRKRKFCLQNRTITHVPTGYYFSSSGYIDVDPAFGPLVADFFYLLSRGLNLPNIATLFNAEGFKTKRGKPWSKTTLSAMLHNPFYLGVYHNGHDGDHPPLVSPEVSLAARQTAVRFLRPRQGHIRLQDPLVRNHVPENLRAFIHAYASRLPDGPGSILSYINPLIARPSVLAAWQQYFKEIDLAPTEEILSFIAAPSEI